jgi:hypothetical protein
LYTILYYKYCWQYLHTIIAIIHFKRSHIKNKFRQLDKFTFNLSIFFNEMSSLQNPFSNSIVNIRLSIIYLLYACRVQSVVPPLMSGIINCNKNINCCLIGLFWSQWNTNEKLTCGTWAIYNVHLEKYWIAVLEEAPTNDVPFKTTSCICYLGSLALTMSLTPSMKYFTW